MKQTIKDLQRARATGALPADEGIGATRSSTRSAAPPFSLPTAAGTERGTQDVRTEQRSMTRDQVVTLIARTVNDKERRKRNVVVTGLPEHSPEEDARAFSTLCEHYLTTKPAIASLGVKRLGQTVAGSGTHRRLLVHLESEEAANAILRAARQLRSTDDPYVANNIYINPDLSVEEQRLAFQRRTQRRAQPVERASPGAAQAPHPPMDTQHTVNGNTESRASLGPTRVALGDSGPLGSIATSDINSVHPAAPYPMTQPSGPDHQPLHQSQQPPIFQQAFTTPNASMFVVNTQHAAQHNTQHNGPSQCANPSNTTYAQHTPGILYLPQLEHGQSSNASGHTYLLSTNQLQPSSSYAQSNQNTNTLASSSTYQIAQYIQPCSSSQQPATYKNQHDYPPLPPPFLPASYLSSTGYKAPYPTAPV